MTTGWKLRDDFEAWVKNPHLLARSTGPGYSDDYAHPWTAGAWDAWKECHERQKPPAKNEADHQGSLGRCVPRTWNERLAMILTDEECANAIGMDLKEWHGRPWTQEDARAIESAVLRKLRKMPADAWLVTGSRIYEDSVSVYKDRAKRMVIDRHGINGRHDGSNLKPLHIIPGEEE